MKTSIEIIRERRLNISGFIENQIMEAMEEYKNQSQPEKEQEVNQLRMLCDARDRALDDAAVRIGEKNDHIKELEAQLKGEFKLLIYPAPIEQPEAQKKHPRLEELRKNIPDDVKREVDAMFEQQNQPQPEKVDDVQWQDIMTTAAGIEPEKDSDTSTITGMIKTVIEICKEHAEDGCFDAEGAEANAIRILTRKQTPNP